MKKIVIGILAHVDSGKTTLSEALLYLSGTISKLGRVDKRDSYLDNFAIERKRGITVFSKQAVMSYKDTIFTLLDTPGHVDFSAEAERSLSVLDYAVLVISGTDGVQSHTLTLWRLLQRYDVPCFVFVNKMDLGGTDRDTLLAQIREKLSDRCVYFGTQSKFDLDENLALCDESLFAAYDKNGSLSDEDIISAIRERRVFPCMFGAALKVDGVTELMDCLYDCTSMPDSGDAFAARVFKISQDNKGNRLTFMKITSGKLRVKEIPKSKKNTDSEKVNEIRIYSGEKYTVTDEATAGTVCAVTGLSFTLPGDGLGDESGAALPLLEPVLAYQLILPDGIDIHTALSQLKQLEAEDPMLCVSADENKTGISIRLMGDIQLEVLTSMIEERFGYTPSFTEGGIVYKETINNTVEGIGHFEPLRHYAEVHLLIKPAQRDSGVTINTKCKEDQLDRNWQRLILTHLHEKTHRGVLTGSELTDVEITLMSGRAHPKHTEGGDFRQATYRAVRQGLRSAQSILLEPVYSFELEIPTENTGKAMTDINKMYGSFDSPVTVGDMTIITGSAPVSTIRGYSREVARYTHGRGRLSCTLKGYEPCHDQDEVIARFGYDPDADTENPCDSIFCSHGAGHNVKWNDVPSHAHLPSVLEKAKESPKSDRERVYSAYRSQRDIFAADRDLMRIFEQTYGPIKKRAEYTAPRHFSADNDRGTSKSKAKAKPSDLTEYVLVDGYNVIHSWDDLKPADSDDLSASRNALVNILCNYRGYRKCELILVFDAYLVKGGERSVEEVSGIHIVYTKEAETADMYIERASLELSKNNRVRVVTSDRMEQLIIIGNGAVRVSSEEFLSEVRAVEDEIREVISSDFK